MLVVSLLLASLVAAANADAASSQLVTFNESISGPIGNLKQSSGCPVQLRFATGTLNTNLLRNEYFMQTVDHIVNERIPERIIHTKGSGAFGYFEVTKNAVDITKAGFLGTDGKKTRVAVRFSSGGLKKGSSDISPGVRGMAIKFYTEDGNCDMPANSIPITVSREPLAFLAFSHATSPNPVTNLADRNGLWDYLTKNPDSLYGVLIAPLSPLGLPLSYRHMPAYGQHTLQLVNSANETYFSRFYFMPDLGIKNMTLGTVTDSDYYARDMYNAIANKTYPSWTVYMQPLSVDQVKNASANGVDVFDVARELSTVDYPLREVGRIVLNENPQNYFADVEQIAFNPGNLVPGIVGGPDKIFEARVLTYRKAQIHRIGINFNKVTVNQPSAAGSVYTYNRDGSGPTLENEKGAPTYYPNSFNGPVPVDDYQPDIYQITEKRTSNLDQASAFYGTLAETEKIRLATSLASTFSGVSKVLVLRAIALLTQLNEDLSARVQAVIAANS